MSNEGGHPSPAPILPSHKVKPTKKEKLMILLRIGTINGGTPDIISKRRIDILGAIIIISFIVSDIVSTLKNDTRIYLLRESTITGTIGLTFLLTLIPIKYGTFQMRPIIYYFAKDMQIGGSFGYTPTQRRNSGLSEVTTQRWELYWEKYAVFRRGFYFLTILWGVSLLLEVLARAIIVFKAPTTDSAVMWTNIVTYSWLGVLILINVLYSKRFKKRCTKIVTEDIRADANQTSV
ncbi:DUF3159 domain-containing protein [Rhizophagus clarus]|uniref:DUF3159 domain-containing protein n=1 Tax=Rhizophagus clarus TaxID=94130 RepID=A0A8H3M288_9GLOM|nr:DUF3159 domain-containing protein [Rhizophagus clarus]